MGIFSDIAEKECIEKRYPHSSAKVPITQHCAAISVLP